MHKRIQRALAAVIAVVLAVSYYAAPASAAVGFLRNASVTLSNSAGDATGVDYTFSVKVNTAATINGIKIAWKTIAPSGTTSVKPTSGSVGNATLVGSSGFSVGGSAIGDWWNAGTQDTVNRPNVAAGELFLINTAGTATNINDTLTFQIKNISNPSIVDFGGVGGPGNDGGCDGAPGVAGATTGTCYFQITTYGGYDVPTHTDAAGYAGAMHSDTTNSSTIAIEKTTVAFTVNNNVTVSAKVDPSLTFTVDGFNKDDANVASAGNLGVGGAAINKTSEASDYKTLGFGNLTPNIPKLMAQKLYVKTNAQNGYTVKVKSGTANPLTGVYLGTIQPFNNNKYANDAALPSWTTGGGDTFAFPSTAGVGGHAMGTLTGGGPQNWAHPTSTLANDYSGVFGASTNDTGVWAGVNATGSNMWAPVSNQASTVKTKNGPDLGTSYTTVTYALEVNTYQPSDSYTGSLSYNCVPVY